MPANGEPILSLEGGFKQLEAKLFTVIGGQTDCRSLLLPSPIGYMLHSSQAYDHLMHLSTLRDMKENTLNLGKVTCKYLGPTSQENLTTKSPSAVTSTQPFSLPKSFLECNWEVYNELLPNSSHFLTLMPYTIRDVLLGELGCKLKAIPICGENQGSIFMASNLVTKPHSKHTNICYYGIHELVVKGKVKLSFIDNAENLINLLTKKFTKFTAQLGLQFPPGSS